MRITRAAKVAAFPLIALALVALIACQGPVGATGQTGEPGDSGPSGTDGAPGAPGADAPIPLTGRDSDVLLDSLKAGKDENEATEYEIDLHAMGYFNGGEAPFKYTVGDIDDSADNDDTITVGATAKIVTAEIDEDTNMLKLKLNAGFSFTDPDFMTGFSVALSAEDANKESADSSLTIKPNRAPVLQTGLTQTDNVLDAAVSIGTMEDSTEASPDDDTDNFRTADAANATCKTMNSCEFDLFDDEGPMTLTAVADPAGKLSFSDEGDGKITITGLEANAENIEVDVTAVDEDGQDFTFRVLVVVDAAPTISEAGQALTKTIKIGVGGTATAIFETLVAAQGAFADADDGQTIAISATSQNESIVTVADAATNGGRLTGVGRGTTTVTVRGTSGTLDGATAGLGQYAEIVFTVTVE